MINYIMLIGGSIFAAISLGVSVFLFIKLDIIKVIGDLTGSSARKNIKRIREKSMAEGNKLKASDEIRVKKGHTTSRLSRSGKLNNLRETGKTVDNNSANVLASNQTTVLPNNNETTVLSYESGTTVLGQAPAMNAASIYFEKEVDILVVHSSETI